VSITTEKEKTGEKMGLTGLEPVTLRLSSACSNQLSYRPVVATPRNVRISIADLRFVFARTVAGNYLNRQWKIANRKYLEARGFEPLTSSLQSWRSTN
jgi:hypothetical protein